MKSLFAAWQYKPLLLSAFAWGWFEVEFIPAPMRIFFLGAAMAIDLASGLVKSWKNGHITTSAGFQRSVVKLSRYCSVIIATWFLANILGTVSPANIDYAYMVNGTIGFLTFIEIYSIFENVYEIDPTGPLSRYLVGPVLKILKGNMNRFNPFNKLNDHDNDTNSKQPDSMDKPADTGTGSLRSD